MLFADTSLPVNSALAGAGVLMKRITVENYRNDKYYHRLVRAVDAILTHSEFVAPTDIRRDEFCHVLSTGTAGD